MRVTRILTPAAALLFAAGLHAQTTEPTPGPTTGGTAPAPTSPTTGGTAPARPLLIFPTDPAATARAAGGTATAGIVLPSAVSQLNGVPAALRLTDRQQTQLNTATQQLQSRFQPQFDRANALPAAERQAQLDQINRAYTAAWLDAARGVLTDAQLTRAQQLQLQAGGLASLNDPVAQKALNLTAAQLAQLKQDVAWSTQQQAAIRQAALTDQARALQLTNAFNAESQARLTQLLTPAQQQSWAQLAGSPFAFQPVFPGPTGTAGVTGTTGFAPGTFAPGTSGGLVMPGTTTTGSGLVMPGTTTVPGRTGPGGTPLPAATPGTTVPGTTTVPGRTGVGGTPIGPTRPTPIVPGASGPTTGGAAPPPVGPTTGGPARPGGPTTGGTAPAGGPTTGGTAPGGPGSPVPPRR